MDDIERIRSLFQKSQPFFSTLGDPIRQELLLNMITGQPLSVKELTERTKLSRPTISHHLKILKEAHIVVEHKEGRQTFYRPQAGEYYCVIKELINVIDKAVKKEATKNEPRQTTT